MDFYVIATQVNASHFTEELASLAQSHGLTPSLGQASDDKGGTLYVLEAKGKWIRLWSQNMPLSGQENPAACGIHAEAYQDPGQYIVTINPELPFLGAGASVKVAAELRQDLSRLGYEVLERPVVCSALAKSAP